MEWLRSHLSHRTTGLPPELREASHRQANESQKLSAEVINAVGGPANYYREADRLRDFIRTTIERTQ